MATECTPTLFAFEAVERKAVVACFDGGAITSNGGALLLGQVDRGLGLVHRFAACFTDHDGVPQPDSGDAGDRQRGRRIGGRGATGRSRRRCWRC